MPTVRKNTLLASYEHEIFLLPGCAEEPVEAFNPRAQTYRTVMKADNSGVTWKTEIAVVVNHSIFIFGNDKNAIEFDLNAGRKKEIEIQGGKICRKKSTSVPVATSKSVVWMLSNPEGIVTFHVQTRKISLQRPIITLN